jgi:hypothetical protein
LNENIELLPFPAVSTSSHYDERLAYIVLAGG